MVSLPSRDMVLSIVAIVVIVCNLGWNPSPSFSSSSSSERRDLLLNGGQKNRPNMLLLVLDQWRYDWDGLHPDTPTGPLPLRMPFLERAAQRGTRFTQAYVPTPLCAPVRACLAAAKEYDEAGVLENHADGYPTNQTTFYRLLRDVGNYHVMSCGKDDLYKVDPRFSFYPNDHHEPPMDLGFSDAVRVAGKNKVTREGASDVYKEFLLNHPIQIPPPSADSNNNNNNNNKEQLQSNAFEVYRQCISSRRSPPGEVSICTNATFTQEIYPDDYVQTQTMELLRRRPKDKPWFLQVNFPGPHPPLIATAQMAASVMDREWPSPIDGTAAGWTCPQQKNNQKGTQQQPPQPQLGGRCNYAAELEHLDGLMQSIVDLVEKDQDDNKEGLIVCITGDHGEMLGDHRLSGKKVPWQPSVSVPLVCYGEPYIPVNAVYDDPVTTLDLPGTFLAAAQVAPLPDMTTQTLPTFTFPSTTAAATLDNNGDALGRAFVSSGLGEWRLVVKAIEEEEGGRKVDNSYKLICCRGQCPRFQTDGTTTTTTTSPWQRLLYNVNQDPHDMTPIINRPDIEELLVPLLPTGWCQEASSSNS